MVDPITGNGTKEVIVRTPCTCKAIRWWACECSDEIARYDVAVFDTILNQSQIKWIQEQHPGTELIY